LTKRKIAFAVEYAKITSVTTLVCSIPEKLDARLEKLAHQAKVPKDKFVRKALEHAVRAPRASGTAFNLVKKLCGSLSGPLDLATNPKIPGGLGWLRPGLSLILGFQIYRREGRQPIPLLIR
jgi:predicted DNA-binding protein